MSTATLTFDMNEPDDIMAHLRATQALNLALIVWGIQFNTFQALESIIIRKMEDDINVDPLDVLEIVREHITDLIKEHGIDINKLIN